MGKPAARITDMHVCPMVTTAVPPVPHVGGPITGPGCPTVLIGGIPAAVMGDMCTCVGPPDTIVLGSASVLIGGKPAARMGDTTAHGGTIMSGCPTVLIGEAGSGGGGLGAMSIAVLQSILPSMPPHLQQKIEQIIAMKEAAKNGTPFVQIITEKKGEKREAVAMGTEGLIEAKGASKHRVAYVKEVEILSSIANKMRAAGCSSEEIARALHGLRRELGVKYKLLTPDNLLQQIYQRNLQKYGDKLGPTIDYLKQQGKSWDDIINSATRSGGKDLGFLKFKQ